MSTGRRFPALGYAYLAATATCGAVVLFLSSQSLLHAPPAAGWLALAALTWMSGAFAIKIPSVSATLSVSEVFVFSAAILFGGPAATVTVAIDGLLTSIYRRNRVPRRVLFNIAEPAVSTGVACYLYDAAGGIPPLSLASAPLGALVVPVLVLAVSYLLLNTWLTAGAMAFESGKSAVAIWRGHIVWLTVNFLTSASIALLLTVNMREVSLPALVLVLPLVFVLYLVFRTWTDRVREAEVHVATVNRLYLSTAEALAIAIESKDRVTHGHVRRVQILSRAIADRLKVTDEISLRAIESGALLHDIGKVAIPDHILDKPDKLTPEEYELMKLHAPIGAEILKAVEFPYPVVPIVRHHHENWNGTGYPDRLAGEDIPIGARIVSVVDCFDALTSHRPYRRALGDEEALEIIRLRRGSMYDPKAVDALLDCYGTLRSSLQSFETPEVSLLIARANPRRTVSAEATAGDQAPPATLGDMCPAVQVAAQPFGREAWAAVPAVAVMLRAMTPATTVCLGRVSRAAQSVEIVQAFGHGEQLLRHATLALGEGLTGWVAAHRSGIANADPALDFPRQVALLTPRLVTALAVPIGTEHVLTLYSDRSSGFGPADRLVVEQAARYLVPMTEANGADPAAATPGPPLPEATCVNDEAMALLPACLPIGRSWGVLSIALAAHVGDRRVDEAGLAALVLPALRLSDGLFTASRDEIVAVLPGCEPQAEGLIRSRLQSVLDDAPEPMGDLAVGFAVAPYDGLSVSAALQTARSRRQILPARSLRRSPGEPVATGAGGV